VAGKKLHLERLHGTGTKCLPLMKVVSCSARVACTTGSGSSGSASRPVPAVQLKRGRFYGNSSAIDQTAKRSAPSPTGPSLASLNAPVNRRSGPDVHEINHNA
jgi:hypothetical protein